MENIEIRSRYLRERLHTHPPSEDNLDLYADLLKLEAVVTATSLGAGRGLLLGHLRRRYPEAFEAIAAELAPGRFVVDRARERRLRQREARKRRRERERFLEQLRAAARKPEES